MDNATTASTVESSAGHNAHHVALGRYGERLAERHLSEAARRDATSATIHDHLGDLYQRRGKPEQARAAWQKALALAVEVDEITRIKAKLNGPTSK